MAWDKSTNKRESFVIVTPTLNSGTMLDETSRSVVENLKEGDEYIIVDGGSTDGSIERVQKNLPKSVRFLRDSGGGMYDAIATGFEQSEKPIMAWLNASDIYLRNALNHVRDAFAKTNAELLYFDNLYISEKSQVIQRSRGNVWNVMASIRAGWTPLQDGCFWTRDAYNRCGKISCKYKHAGDYDYFLRAFQKSEVKYIPEIVSCFRRHSGQLSSEISKYKAEKELIREHESNSKLNFVTVGIARIGLTLRAKTKNGQIKSNLLGKDARYLRAGNGL